MPLYPQQKTRRTLPRCSPVPPCCPRVPAESSALPRSAGPPLRCPRRSLPRCPTGALSGSSGWPLLRTPAGSLARSAGGRARPA
eukprot:6594875-Alexandrium_andersonii.AAC.1